MNIKKIATQEVQLQMQEALERISTAQGNYNATVKQMSQEMVEAVKQSVEEAVERLSSSQGNYNATVRQMSEDIASMKESLTDIYAAVVTKQG